MYAAVPSDQPQRVVVESGSDRVVSALGERLVLVVRAAVLELSGRDVDDALARALGNQVHKAKQVLVGVAEAHAAADPGLEVRGRTRHVVGHHALVLVPDVDHPVELVVGRVHRVRAQQVVPIGVELGELRVGCLVGGEVCEQGFSPRLVDDARGFPLVVLAFSR